MAEPYSASLDGILELDPVPDLIDFLNFDGDSAAESSPQTISDNHTPSPAAFALSPPQFDPSEYVSYDFAEEDKKLPLGGPATMGDQVVVKQEPMDFDGTVQESFAPTAQPAVPAPQAALPIAQQAALQELLSSFVNYQQQYGLSLNPSGIDPSLLALGPESTPTSSLTPASQAVTAMTNTPSACTLTGSVSTPVPSIEVSDSMDEPLVAVSPGEIPSVGRSVRADSVFSGYSGEGIEEKIEKLVPLSSIFSAGRGKGGKKGGGMSSVVRGDDEDVDDDDSWRPSPEEYKKLSSKEKRQLRNKLSARAFRTRRKDYIGTLEAHIKDRDSVIDDIRAELSTSRAENQDLRRELEALKASTMNVLHPETANQVGQSPAMLKALAQSDLPAPKAPAAAPTRRQTPLTPINTRKDVSPFDTSARFWGGGNENMFGGGSTICHTLLTPELTLPAQPNLNPLLNSSAASPARKPMSLRQTGDRDIDSSTFAEWSENTPYSMRSMDNYRLQLWSRLAREAAGDKASISPDLRPKFFTDASENTTLASAFTAAAAATEHVASRLSSSFWSAFTGPTSRLDADKLAAVVTGKARLAVVASEKTPFKLTTPARADQSTDDGLHDALAHAMAGLKVATGSSPSESLRVRENPLGAMVGMLKHAAQPAPAATRA